MLNSLGIVIARPVPAAHGLRIEEQRAAPPRGLLGAAFLDR